MYLEYHTVVVLCWFFWFWREIVFGVTYVLSVQYSCAVGCVSFFVVAGKLILYEYSWLYEKRIHHRKFNSYVGSMRSGAKNFRSAALSTATQPW
jgi:hypothetical protein